MKITKDNCYIIAKELKFIVDKITTDLDENKQKAYVSSLTNKVYFKRTSKGYKLLWNYSPLEIEPNKIVPPSKLKNIFQPLILQMLIENITLMDISEYLYLKVNLVLSTIYSINCDGGFEDLLLGFKTIMEGADKYPTHFSMSERISKLTAQEFKRLGLNVTGKYSAEEYNAAITKSELLRYTQAININFSDDDRYAILKYNVRRANLCKLSRFARGIVLDTHNGDIILRPFDKFYNIGENNVTLQDVDSLLKKQGGFAVNKLDGSLISGRYHNGGILLATGGAISQKVVTYGGRKNLNHVNLAYSQLTVDIEKMIQEMSNCTFIFETISTVDPKIIKYSQEKSGLHLIGIRNMDSGELFTQPEIQNVASQYNVPYEGYQVLSSMQEVDDLFTLPEFKSAEGAVIYSGKHIYKYKTDAFVTTHHLDSFNPSLIDPRYKKPNSNMVRHIVSLLANIIVDDSQDDYLSKLKKGKDYEILVDLMVNKLNDFDNLLDIAKSNIQPAWTPRDISICINSLGLSKNEVVLLQATLINSKALDKIKSRREKYLVTVSYPEIWAMFDQLPIVSRNN